MAMSGEILVNVTMEIHANTATLEQSNSFIQRYSKKMFLTNTLLDKWRNSKVLWVLMTCKKIYYKDMIILGCQICIGSEWELFGNSFQGRGNNGCWNPDEVLKENRLFKLYLGNEQAAKILACYHLLFLSCFTYIVITYIHNVQESYWS